MSDSPKVLVVGTTSDYIDWIRSVAPGRALFLTAPENRIHAVEPPPAPMEEIVCDLDDVVLIRDALEKHFHRWQISIDGIACFDCESMELAAILAAEFSLPYPSLQSIRLCRDKYATKSLWRQKGVNCPQARLIGSADEAFDFVLEIDGPCVIKPLSGSGSELVFLCASQKSCDETMGIVEKELMLRESHRLYKKRSALILAEEFIEGEEYSCDAVIMEDRVEIVRLTRKIRAPERPFGTILGYVLASNPPEGIEPGNLERILWQGAKALGISHAICMVDFLVCEDELVLLEMTPRPGGDCLPSLLRCSRQLDILMVALDLAQQRPLTVNGRVREETPSIGLRFHARQPGVVRAINSQLLQADPRVMEVNILRSPGHRITMPPADYDSWYMGHVIFRPTPGIPMESQCYEVGQHLVLEIA